MGGNSYHFCLLLCVFGCCLFVQGEESTNITSVNSTVATTGRKLVVDFGYKLPLKVLVVAGFLCVIVIAFFAIRYYRTQRRRKIVKRYSRVRSEGEELAQAKEDSGPDSEIELYEKK